MISNLQQQQYAIMSYVPSTMNAMQLMYAADAMAAYTPMLPPTSSPPPFPVPGYNNSSGTGGGGGDYGESDYALAVTAGVNSGGGDVVKRKRGRPRKNASDGSVPVAQGGGLSSPAPSSGKRPRGRPPGSMNKQQHAAAAAVAADSGVPGAGFMTHVLDVKSREKQVDFLREYATQIIMAQRFLRICDAYLSDEDFIRQMDCIDVLAKLVWFSQTSTRALCILSATGTISKVSLQQTAISGGIVTYEGRFEILSLSGSFTVPESDDQRSRICGLTVALSGPDGCILGGNVVGHLIAASPVKVIVGSFIPISRKQSKERGSSEAEGVNGSANMVSGSLSESSGGVLWSPVGQSNNSDPQGMVNILWE